MPTALAPYFQLHLCVLLWGFTAILGKLISLPAVALVWWRMALVTACLLVLPRVWRGLRALSPRLLGTYAGIGIVVSLHWLSFYGAIKLANASVAVTCLAVAPVFTALIEPWITRRALVRRELWLGLGVIPGVALVVGGVETGFRLGIVLGLLSALLASLFATLNKRYVHRADPMTVTAVEIGAGALFLGLVAPWFAGGIAAAFPLPQGTDIGWMALLVVACTLLPFVLSLVALRHISAFTAQLAVNLEPLYAILLAALIFGEQRELTVGFYAGVGLILFAVFLHPWWAHRDRRRAQGETLATAEGPI